MFVYQRLNVKAMIVVLYLELIMDYRKVVQKEFIECI